MATDDRCVPKVRPKGGVPKGVLELERPTHPQERGQVLDPGALCPAAAGPAAAG